MAQFLLQILGTHDLYHSRGPDFLAHVANYLFMGSCLAWLGCETLRQEWKGRPGRPEEEDEADVAKAKAWGELEEDQKLVCGVFVEMEM